MDRVDEFVNVEHTLQAVIELRKIEMKSKGKNSSKEGDRKIDSGQQERRHERQAPRHEQGTRLICNNLNVQDK